MDESIYYNALAREMEADYGKLAKLLAHFGSWEEAWKNARAIDKKHDPTADWEKLGKSGVKLLLRHSPGFPKLLREIPHPPFGIYVIGNLAETEKTSLAIVGTRKATIEGKELAKKFAAELAQNGFVIASGLALGVDAAAHAGCLAGGGLTIAVLGNGLDAFYPRANERLAKEIIEKGGAIISEYPLGAPPLPYRFLERNRIVSGLSRGTLVIEAPENSGSLATARFALDQNRDVFVTPGPVAHPNFKGSHKLIRQGAELVTSAEEILEVYGLSKEVAQKVEATTLTPEESKVLSALRGASGQLNVDKIIEMTTLEPRVANQTLTFLLMKDLIKESGDGYIIDK